MKKILIGLAILTVSTSAGLAAHKTHAMKPKAAAATTSPGPFMGATPSAADHTLYMKNQHDSGMKK
jgi:hypothetical protein